MDPFDVSKMEFISNDDNYYYNATPFSLKNAYAIYQRLMDTVFSQQIKRNIEVYVDDMIIKSS